MRCLESIIGLFPPEYAHQMALWAIGKGWLYAQAYTASPVLETEIAGLSLTNPVGLAAGFDKNAQTLPYIADQGFGFIECGTVTPKPQSGNPKPRVFRLREHQAVINRLGFNNLGVDVFADHVKSHNAHIPVGGNIGKNAATQDAISDYMACAGRLYDHVDYLTLNISSPNTQGLRELQNESALMELVGAVDTVRQQHIDQGSAHKPLFVKLAPDLSDDAVKVTFDAIQATSADGVILTNTTTERPINHRHAHQIGGLSGVPLQEKACHITRVAYQHTGGEVPLIGVGGIDSPDAAYARIRAGASALQLYTGIIYHGFELVTQIKRGLIERLSRDGISSVRDAVGLDM